jgi:hypothetical protein
MTKKLEVKIRETKDLGAGFGLDRTTTWPMISELKFSVKVARHIGLWKTK